MKHSQSSKFLIGIIVIVVMVVYFSIPDAVDQSKLSQASELTGLGEDVILANTVDTLFFEDILDQPDLVVEEIKFNFSEETVVDARVTELELVRTITFDDNTKDTQSTKPTTLDALDFIAVKDDLREIGNGEISFDIDVPVEKEIRLSQAEFTFYYIEDNDPEKKRIVKTSFSQLEEVDVNDGVIQILLQDVELNPLLVNSGVGFHTLELVLEKFFIIYEDNSREFVTPLQTIYSIEIEKSDSQTIKKDEAGNLVKSFDFDVPITISSNHQGVAADMCLSRCRGGGCCSHYFTSAIIPAPSMGAVTITNLETNKVVASSPAVKGVCTNTDYRFNSISANLSNCKAVSGGGGLGFSAQRGQSYEIHVADPNKTWTINVPESGGSFTYSCIDSKTATPTGKIAYGNYGTSQQLFTIDGNRACNFP
jgi:hypothetical protein